MNKIVLCGGHLSPALAVIEALEGEDLEIIFFGRRHVTEGHKNLSSEYSEVTKTKATFIGITTGRLQRKFTPFMLISLLKLPLGFIQSLYFLLKFKPDLIVSFGSYHSVPTVIAGWLLKIKSIAHEQASIPGLATKINSHFVRKIFLTWPESSKYISGPKTQIVGNLTRKLVFAKTAKSREIKNFLKSDGPKIFITGGNQGSHFINKIIFEALPKLKKYKIIHQVGRTNFKGDLDHAKQISKPWYLPLGFIPSQDIGAIFNSADLVIGRSGANTVWELALLAKISILIPLPHSAYGEQEQNAANLQKAGSSAVINQQDASPNKLIGTIDEMIKNQEVYQNKARELSKKLPSNGIGIVKKYILKTLHAQST
ncbi:hypothetical protein A2870_03215 [Candidatus Curtissbacteria bacterium RIFCSPHIGHO2_01_FULL_41_11]|uniref:UDP-N-acetylglucosamine--N-acetylmuramyl-(pentapeptide) pyrophosphoryl-undecaprenol N-acetylglucosamine transferase n=1 Tax=Candidatus Curtissbacteria bacterium RIFCSPHIGHO2_01_FULL_41_11 TaxID=1797711 RepID=A0A1F5G4Y8_9BACT|nr:MAG: hypothetical protein A2870_03215 [Candidatus Curtissbacteria bacterium RIFCSPHIGHO2_01_FULL_41_11]